MHHSYTAIISSPIGKLGIITTDSYLVCIDFLSDAYQTYPPHNSLAQQVCDELTAYFINSKHKFTLPLAENGTSFQKTVWQTLRNISSGSTLTYGQLAMMLETSARAIGNACRANPIPIIIPCHRIVAKQQLGGYSGNTSAHLPLIKQWLIEHEAR